MLLNCEENYDADDDIAREINIIKKKEKTYNSLWRLFSIANKLLMIINFATLLFCVLIPNSNIGLVLSIYTLSFSIICNTSTHVPTLEKLIIVYQDEIIPQIEKYVRCIATRDAAINCDDISEIQELERDILDQFMGKGFRLVNTLRDIDHKKIFFCALMYIILFICIPIAYHYASLNSLLSKNDTNYIS